MASVTTKTKRRRKAKKTAIGQRRKREIRREARARTAALAERLGLAPINQPGDLAVREAKNTAA